MSRAIPFTTALIVLSMTAVPSAFADQAAADTRSAAADDTVVLEDVLVSARRREESMQKVPVAVTALSGDELRRWSLDSVSDLERVVPSMTVGPTGGRKTVPGFTIRGQRDSLAGITNDPAVGVYIAEAVQTRPTGLGKALFDLESVQVLKGPQGTLFGRNTTGGAILIQPKRPSLDKMEGYAQTTFGDYNRFDLQGAVNLPLGDKWAVRVAGNRTRRDGFAQNVTTGLELDEDSSEAGRVSVLFQPSDAFDNTLYLDAVNSDQEGNPMKLIAVRPGSLADTRFGYVSIFERQQATQGFYDVEGNAQAHSSVKGRGATNVSVIRLNGFNIKNIANYRRMDQTELMDYDGTAQAVLVVDELQNADQYSDEVQFSGTAFADRLTWITGLYYFRETGDRATRSSAQGNPPNPRYSDATNTSKSIFAQGDWTLTPKLTATLGARYTEDERELTQRLYNPAMTVCTLCQTRTKDSTAPTWTAGLSYQMDDDTLVYLTHRRGYRAGGFNSTAISVGQLTPFDQETVTDFEAGFKSDWHLGSALLRTNVAVYRSDYADIQRGVTVVIDGSPVRSTFNAAEATINGAELEFTLLATTNIEISGSASYTDAKYDKFIDPSTGRDLSGNSFAYTPKSTYRIAGRYRVPFVAASTGELSVSADYFWQDKVEFGDETFPFGAEDSYGLASARIELSNIGGGAFTVAAFGENLTDKEYTVYRSNFWTSTGFVPAVLGNPRTWGVQVSYQF